MPSANPIAAAVTAICFKAFMYNISTVIVLPVLQYVKDRPNIQAKRMRRLGHRKKALKY
jgi:hypothetical protein